MHKSEWSSDSSACDDDERDNATKVYNWKAPVFNIAGSHGNVQLGIGAFSSRSSRTTLHSDLVLTQGSPPSIIPPELPSSSDSGRDNATAHWRDSGSDKENIPSSTRGKFMPTYDSDAENMPPAQLRHVAQRCRRSSGYTSVYRTAPRSLQAPLAALLPSKIVDNAPRAHPLTDITPASNIAHPATLPTLDTFTFAIDGPRFPPQTSQCNSSSRPLDKTPSGSDPDPSPARELIRLHDGTFEYWPEKKLGKGASGIVVSAQEQPICTDGPPGPEMVYDVALKIVKKNSAYKSQDGRAALIDELRIWRTVTESDKPFLNRLIRAFDLGKAVVFVSVRACQLCKGLFADALVLLATLLRNSR